MKSLDEIANELAGYDPQALSADMVQAFLAKLVEPVSSVESVTVFEALGRVLAQDIISPISVPPHDNSAMDGYAFDGAQLGSRRMCAHHDRRHHAGRAGHRGATGVHPDARRHGQLSSVKSAAR